MKNNINMFVHEDVFTHALYKSNKHDQEQVQVPKMSDCNRMYIIMSTNLLLIVVKTYIIWQINFTSNIIYILYADVLKTIFLSE